MTAQELQSKFPLTYEWLKKKFNPEYRWKKELVSQFLWFKEITNEDLKECFSDVVDELMSLNKVNVYTENNAGYCSVYTDGSMECEGVFSPLQFSEIIKLRDMIEK